MITFLMTIIEQIKQNMSTAGKTELELEKQYYPNFRNPELMLQHTTTQFIELTYTEIEY